MSVTEKCFGVERLGQEVGIIIICVDSVGADLAFIIQGPDISLRDPVMLGRRVVDGFDTLFDHTVVVCSDGGGTRHGKFQLSEQITFPNHFLGKGSVSVGLGMAGRSSHFFVQVASAVDSAVLTKSCSSAGGGS